MLVKLMVRQIVDVSSEVCGFDDSRSGQHEDPRYHLGGTVINL